VSSRLEPLGSIDYRTNLGTEASRVRETLLKVRIIWMETQKLFHVLNLFRRIRFGRKLGI